MKNLFLISFALLITTGCAKVGEELESAAATSSDGDYSIYVASGYPIASGVGTITKWTADGQFSEITHDYATSTGYLPVGMVSDTVNGESQLLALAFNGTYGRVDNMRFNGSNYALFFDNATALIAGTRRISKTSDGGYLITRTAGVERFNSSKQRVGAAARYAGGGTCATTAVAAATEVTISGTTYVVTANAAATPNNKLNLYNGGTGACISGTAPASPGTLHWPVDLEYVESESKLFVLYYPFTGAASNAQIWSFDVSSTTISNGTLLYNDAGGDIAVINAAPGALSSALTFYDSGTEKFLLVATSNNSVIKLTYDGTTLTKNPSYPLIYQSVFSRSISDVLVVPN